MTIATKATGDSHDNGTCHHDAGEACPAQQATGEQQGRDDGFDDGSRKDARARERQRLQVDLERHVLSEPRGLARLDAHGLAQLRAIVLRVVDDGDPATGIRWQFEASDFTNDPLDDDLAEYEAKANAQRLDFCDAITAEIVRRTTPAAQQAKGGQQ